MVNKMKLEKTTNYLQAVTNKPKTEKEAKWYLAMWTTAWQHELNWKDHARELQSYIETPPAYEDLEERLLDQLTESPDEIELFTKKFYGV